MIIATFKEKMIKYLLDNFFLASDDVYSVLMPIYLISKAVAITPYVLQQTDGNIRYAKSRTATSYCCIFVALFVGKWIPISYYLS